MVNRCYKGPLPGKKLRCSAYSPSWFLVCIVTRLLKIRRRFPLCRHVRKRVDRVLLESLCGWWTFKKQHHAKNAIWKKKFQILLEVTSSVSSIKAPIARTHFAESTLNHLKKLWATFCKSAVCQMTYNRAPFHAPKLVSPFTWHAVTVKFLFA